MGIKEIDNSYIMNTYKRQNVVIVSGKSATCIDENGQKYIDFGSGIGVNSLGYCNDLWCKEVTEQACKLQHVSNYYYTEPDATVAKKLCEITGYKKAFFGNSGAEANECAIKIARKYSFDKYKENPNRNKIITLINSFHGRTVTTLTATGQDVFHNYFFPFTDGFDYAKANDINSIKEKVDENTCAIMFEFIQGEGGVISLNYDFIKQLSDFCKENDILMIADEVQTGIGRSGKLLASEHFGIKPNITTLAKGLGGGLPIGCVLTDEKTQSVLLYSDHGTTFGGNPVSCAGAKAVLNTVANEKFLNEVVKKGDFIRKSLNSCEEIENITGIGMMVGIKLKNKKAVDVLEKCKENGLLVLTARDKIRLLPPLNITQEELEEGVKKLKKVIEE